MNKTLERRMQSNIGNIQAIQTFERGCSSRQRQSSPANIVLSSLYLYFVPAKVLEKYFLHVSLSLGNSSSPLSDGGFPWSIIWKCTARFKVSFFVWEASHGRILTCDNLQKGDKTLANKHFYV